MVSPVFGLRPVRAARSRTWKVPKPTRVTASPSFSALVTAATTASTARLDSALVRSAASATASINSVLFILYNSFGGGFRGFDREATARLLHAAAMWKRFADSVIADSDHSFASAAFIPAALPPRKLESQ
ncbi:hypothetical protein G6F40_014496 [Rhizopus arrhizus]|nr:hypothetical protein G6F40_014496 [Rhizopus arrhizus]